MAGNPGHGRRRPQDTDASESLIIGEFDDRKVERAAGEMNRICHTQQD